VADPISARDLAAFVAAVEAGSVQGASEALDLTQSATTKRIQALERRLGVSLLVRGRQGTRPSEEGRALYPEARRALDALASAERSVAASKAAQPLRIAASHTVGEFLLPGWLGAFRLAAPDLHPQVDVDNSPGVIEALRESIADVGFVEGLDPLDGLDAKVVARDEIVVAAATGHRWARRRSIRPQELGGERYVSRESGSGTRAVSEARLAEVGVHLEPDLTLASLAAVKRSLGGGGFTLISRLALEPQASAGLLTPVVVKDLRIDRALIAIRRAGGGHRDAGRRFWSWLDRRAVTDPAAGGD
jgi:DNA-binding transcriptional LysR family regulator